MQNKNIFQHTFLILYTLLIHISCDNINDLHATGLHIPYITPLPQHLVVINVCVRPDGRYGMVCPLLVDIEGLLGSQQVRDIIP